MTLVAVLGVGSVGARVVRQVLATGTADSVVAYDPRPERVLALREELGDRLTLAPNGRLERADPAVLVVCAPAGHHVEPIRRAIRRHVPAVSISDRLADVRGLLDLDRRAADRGVRVVAGAGFSPGLTCALAALMADRFDAVDEIHVAKDGTGGPARARQHHRALKMMAIDWRDGAWVRRPGGSGRELVWFPSPVDGADCYRAALPEALLLQPVFGDARRITARRSASRQDRFTTWLPMLSPPPAEGAVGAVRVELRGRRHGAREVRIVGSACRPAEAAATIAAITTDAVVRNAAGEPGVGGIAASVPGGHVVREAVARGVSIVEFEGTGL